MLFVYFRVLSLLIVHDSVIYEPSLTRIGVIGIILIHIPVIIVQVNLIGWFVSLTAMSYLCYLFLFTPTFFRIVASYVVTERNVSSPMIQIFQFHSFLLQMSFFP